MLAIAFKSEEKIICCVCALKEANTSEHPHLYFQFAENIKIDCEEKCQICNKVYGNRFLEEHKELDSAIQLIFNHSWEK